ncbi:MAG: hypothetical protein AAF533_09355 [Acidobacteriota bacterium]
MNVADTALEGLELRQRMRNGLSWFYWIAGLSAVNTLAVVFQSQFRFLIGLELTDVIGSFVGGPVASGLSLGLAGLLALFGWLSLRGHGWAALVGIAIYLVDCGLALLGGLQGGFRVDDLISLAFHAWALFGLITGWRALVKLQRMRGNPLAMPPSSGG